MSIIERLLPAERAAKLLASGVCFAVANLALKLFIHGVYGEFGGWDFRAGALVGFFGVVVLGSLLALPSLFAEAGRAITLALAILALTYDAFAYSTYAETGHLPTASALFGYAASADLAFAARAVGLGAVASLGYGLGTAALEPRLVTRFASLGVRLADLATVLLFGLFGVATLIAGDGPLYYGVTHPVVHLVAGRVQERPEPFPENEPHTHHHGHDHHEEHRHEHGFVHEDALEPFPADGIPRPAESMRLQYQGLLGVEAPQPILDTAYPYCRSEAEPAPLSESRDVVVVDLSGLSRAAFEEELSPLAELPRGRVEFERVHAVSTTHEEGRRALFTGIPPTVARRFVPDVSNLPSAAFAPRYPSIAASLGAHGVHTAYFGPDPGTTGKTRLELATLGFDLRSYGAEHPVSASADDLDSLSRLDGHLRKRQDGPRFAFLELRSIGAGDQDPRVIAALVELVRSRPRASFVFTSDHVRGSGQTLEAAELDVPFVVFAGDAPEPEGESLTTRLGSTYDLPQTVLGLFGGASRFCHQGRDLMSTDEPFPARRVAFAQVGEGERSFILFEARAHGAEVHRWNVDGQNPLADETPVSLFELTADPARKNDLFSRKDPDWPQLEEFWRSHLAIGVYLLRTDRFRPPSEAPVAARRGAKRLADGEGVVFEKVDRIPSAAGRYLVSVRALDRGATLDEILAGKRRGSTAVLDVRAGALGSHEALEAWLGKFGGAVDGLLFDELGMALAHAERSSRAVGLWLRPSMGDRDSLFEQLGRAGVDFLMMPLASESAVRRAKRHGLEVWVPRAVAEGLEGVTPDAIVDSAAAAD